MLREPDGENRYKIAKHLVGFANHNGEKLVFGVNDDQEPEGKELLEEKSLGTISEIISTRISPSINFSYLYFSADNSDLSQGSIFVVDVHQSSSPIPHAIIEQSGGEIRKREYRIRAGESTRLVSNEELLTLFKDHTNINLEYSGSRHFLLDDDYSPAETTYKPRYQYPFNRHFWELGSDDETLIEKIKDGSSDHSDRAIRRIVDAQYALTVSTILSHPEFIFVSEKELADQMNNQVDKLTFTVKSIEPSDIILNSDSNPLIDKTAMEKPGILPGYDSRFDYFKIPESANVSIWKDFDGFDIHNDHFSLSFSVDLIEVGVGLPTPHPDSVPEPGEYGLIAQNRSNATMDSHITINSKFK
ncbi:AlbA family DNA-binding domain-containing protein [Halalkalicoccus salilacus]|uniref:AlbA family DNA-binding domain-containing protein n=1 Tax=Halalkalicoccus TaxID=332246 RepID=UPI002F962C02